jgi:dipeptidyl aminopeptidase/acylaminoacyl peptidase
MSRRGLSLFLFMLVLAGTLSVASGATAAPGDVLAFVRDGDIWTMNGDGTNEVNLTDHPAIDEHPDWSPDGTQLAFISNRDDVPGNADGNLEIFVMNADGTGVRQVTDTVYPFPGQGGYDHYEPDWSPGGTRIAYSWNSPDGSVEVYTINVDGTDEVPVTDPEDQANKWGPEYSPDGTRLLYTWGFGYLTGQDLHTISPDGTGEVNLTPDTINSDELLGTWSPDGTRIAFVSTRDPGAFGLPNEEIYVMQADGSGVIRVTDDTAFDTEPAWSPDGTTITFSSSRNGAYDLFSIPAPPPPGAASAMTATPRASGDGAIPLTDTPVDEGQPTWRPVRTFTLLVRRSGPGSVRSNPAGIACGRDCRQTYTAGTVVRLTAVPGASSSFDGWGGSCRRFGQNPTCFLRMDGPRLVTATFVAG